MTKTKIEWADAVWNPVTGCTKISEGCDNCYAEKMVDRLQKIPATQNKYQNGFKVTCHKNELAKPLSWKKRRKIFVCSMGDLFHDDVPFKFIAQIYGIMSMCPQHTFMLLTKRPDRALKFYQWCEEKEQELYKCPADQNIYLEYLPGEIVGPYTEKYGDNFPDEIPLNNIWLGVTAENQARADERIPILLQIPAAVRFVSVEPMLGPLTIRSWCPVCRAFLIDSMSPTCGTCHSSTFHVDWVICGGESGPNARPMHPDWVKSLRNQCKAANVPFFFKQWGEWKPISVGENVPQFAFVKGPGHDGAVWRVGKKAAGRELDGKEYLQFPEAQS